MKTSVFKINVEQTFKNFTTRDQGIHARNQLLAILENHHIIELDFQNANLSVSFVDECLGVLAELMPDHSFKNRIQFKNLSSQLNTLINHILIKRLSTY